MNNADRPAMPYTKGEHDCDMKIHDTRGLTKREYFAAMAMQGILSNPNWHFSEAYAASAALVEADELLRQFEL